MEAQIKNHSKQKMDDILDDFTQEFNSKFEQGPDWDVVSQMNSEELEAKSRVKLFFTHKYLFIFS